MGSEFRIKAIPSIEDIRKAVIPALEASEQVIDSCLLVTTPQKLGIASESTIGTDWPQCCDLMIEETGTIYALGHNSIGCQIILRVIKNLKTNGYAIEVDDDI